MDCTRFGNKLTYYREKNEMTEKELARKLHISTRKVIKLENSETEPDIHLVNRISNLFGVDFMKYLDMDEKHGGSHTFDVDDPEYSPLTVLKEKKKKTPKPAVQRTRTRSSSGNPDLARAISKILMAVALLGFVFLQDIADSFFGDSFMGVVLIPIPFVLLIIAIFLGKRR